VARERDPSREVFWRRALRRRAGGGMTIAQFCAGEGLTTAAYHYWQREIKRRDAESQPPAAATASEPLFAPVQVIDDRHGAAPVEIIAGNGYVIRVGEQATSEQLRRVLQAIDELR
jgi:hypothetical protein